MSDWISIPELAERLGVPATTIYQRSRARKAVPHTMIRDEKVFVDADWFAAEHKKLASARSARGKKAATVEDRAAGQARRNRRRTESNAVRRHRLTVDVGGVPASEDWIDAELDALDEEVAESGDRDEAPPDYLDERRKWSARMEQIRYLKMAGEVVDRGKVETEAFEVARLARDQLLGIPDRVSGLIAGVSSTDKVFAILDDEIRKVLEDLCDAIEKSEIDDTVDLEQPEGEK